MTIEAIVDELGALEAELSEPRLKIKRAELLRKRLQALHDDKPGEDTFSVEGLRYVAFLGEKSNVRTVRSKAKLIKTLGAARFRELAEVTLAKLEGVLSNLELSQLFLQARTGSRFVRVLPKGNA